MRQVCEDCGTELQPPAGVAPRHANSAALLGDLVRFERWGNVVELTEWTATWPSSAPAVAGPPPRVYQYDALGRRNREPYNKELYYDAFGNIIEEREPFEVTQYVWGVTGGNHLILRDLATDGGVSNSGLLADDPDATAVDPSTWRLVSIHAEQTWADGTLDTWEVRTLQPADWLAMHQADVGGWIDLPAVLDLAEMGAPQGLRGRIVSVNPAPQIEDGPGRVVTTTVNHLNGFVFDLTLRKADGRIDTLGVTGYHRFFDEADGWQQVVELQLGDVLRTQSGRVEVLAIQRLAGTHRVYNLTVAADHVYYVGDLTTLAHNVCPDVARRFGIEVLDDGAGLRYRGRTVDVIEDLSHLDEYTLRRIFETGRTPYNSQGLQITLHHVGQDVRGHLWELGRPLHVNNAALHPLGNASGVGRTLAQELEYSIWRAKYWRARAGTELLERGIVPWK